jgi:hypothetical protein
MKRWLIVIGIAVWLAGCAGRQTVVDAPDAGGPTPTSAEASVVGRVLVPAESAGMRLLVTEVSFMELGSGKHNFIVTLELTNIDLDQSTVTKDVFEFSDAAGTVFKPYLLNIHAPQKRSETEYTLQRGETQPFSVLVSSDSADGMTLAYRPAPAAAPLRVAVVSAPANPQSRFRDLDLFALAAPQDEFSRPIRLVDSTRTAVSFSRTAFAEPERFMQASLLSGQEDIGHLSIYVYDDTQNNQIIFDSRRRFVSAYEPQQVEQLGPTSMYVGGKSGLSSFVLAGFVQCHSTVIIFFSNADPSLFPAKDETIAYLEGLKQRLEPQVCR